MNHRIVSRLSVLVLSSLAACGGGGGGGGLGPGSSSPGGTILNSPTLVSGATVTFDGPMGTYSTESTSHGTFRVDGVPDGVYDVTISGKGVFDSSGEPIADKLDLFYPDVTVGGGTTFLAGRPVFLPEKAMGTAIDTGGTTMAVLPAGTVIANASAGISLLFEVATTVTFPSADDTTLSITPVPVEQLPFPLPAGLTTAGVVSIQPLGVTFDAPPRITYANTNGIPAGTKDVTLYRFDDDAAAWVQFGTGKVSVGGDSIRSDAGQGPPETGWSGVVVPTFCATTVTGNVQDGLGNGIEGVVVTTVNGASDTTDVNGDFSIADVPLPSSTFEVVVTALPEANTGFLANDSAPMIGVCGGTTDMGNVVLPDDAVDVTAPTVLSTTPMEGATGVADNASLSVTFSEIMSPGTLNASTIRLECNGAPLTGVLALGESGGKTVATFLPTSLLPLDGACVLTVDGDVLDGAGNALGADFALSFQTAPATAGGAPSIEVTVPGATAMDPGATQQLGANVLDAGGNPLVGAMLTWHSDAPGVLAVDAAGVVTALAPGAANVTASFGSVSDVQAFTVNTPPIAAVAVIPDTQGMVVGANVDLSVEAQDGGGSPLSGFSFVWTSDTPSVATVDATGSVTAVSAGSATITCTEPGSGYFDTATITVANGDSVIYVSVMPAKLTLGVGDAQQLTASALDFSKNFVPGVTFTWSSSNPSIASVTSAGVVTGHADGDVTISALADGSKGVTGWSSMTCVTPTRLVVTLRGGNGANDPINEAYVSRHDPDTGAILDEVMTDESGMADFGLLLESRTTITASWSPDGWICVRSLIDVPVGEYVLTDGRGLPVATFGVQAGTLSAFAEEVRVFTSGFVAGDTFSTFAQPPQITLSGVEAVQRQGNGKVSLIVVDVDSTDLGGNAGFLLDLDPPAIDETLLALNLSPSNMTTIPYSSNVAAAPDGGFVRRGDAVWDETFGGESSMAESGFLTLAVPPGSDALTARLEVRSSAQTPTSLEHEIAYTSPPASIAATIPEISIDTLSWDDKALAASFSVSGAGASTLDCGKLVIDYVTPLFQVPVNWVLFFDPTSTSVALPELQSGLQILGPPAETFSYEIDLVAASGISGFDGAITQLQAHQGNEVDLILDAQVTATTASRQKHRLSFSISGGGTVTIDDGGGAAGVGNGSWLIFDDGRSLTVTATANAGNYVSSMTWPGGSASGGTTANGQFALDESGSVGVVFAPLP